MKTRNDEKHGFAWVRKLCMPRGQLIEGKHELEASSNERNYKKKL
jgi:hypothetical protein